MSARTTTVDSPFSMLSVGDRVPNNILKEDLENTTCLLIYEARNTLHTTTSGQASNGRLGDTYCLRNNVSGRNSGWNNEIVIKHTLNIVT
jgi:hypothetical protein